MKLNRLIPFVVFVGMSTAWAQAQSYEATSKWNKKNEPCVAISVNATEEVATESLFSLLKSEKLKGKRSGKTLKFEKVIFPAISSDYLNIYAKSEARDNNNTIMYLFINRGEKSDFISSSSDNRLIHNLMDYLNRKYDNAATKANFDYKVDVQKKLIKDSEKNLKDMQKDLEKKIKQKESLENEIKNLTDQIREKNRLLDQQNDDLKKISL